MQLSLKNTYKFFLSFAFDLFLYVKLFHELQNYYLTFRNKYFNVKYM